MTERPAMDVEAAPAPAAPTETETFVARVNEIEAELRKETKETLLIFVAMKITWQGYHRHHLAGVSIEAGIAEAVAELREWRASARSASRHRRFMNKLDRIKAGDYGKPRRRKRRKARKDI